MRKITITPQEADALRSIVKKLNTTQLTLEPEVDTGEDPMHHYTEPTRKLIQELEERYGEQWIDIKDAKLKKLRFKYQISNLGAILRNMEERRICLLETTRSGSKEYISRFKLAL